MSRPRYSYKLDIEQENTEHHFIYFEVMFDQEDLLQIHICEEWEFKGELQSRAPMNFMLDYSHMQWLIEMLQDALLKSKEVNEKTKKLKE